MSQVHHRRLHLAVLLGLGLTSAFARPAFGNGAFPDGLQILLPADRPGELALATNFGLIMSNDAGKTWTWVCEGEMLTSANLFQVGPPPSNRLVAVSRSGVVSSLDGACGWDKASGTIDGALAVDAFPDPGDANHVLAIAILKTGTGQNHALFESTNGGNSFDTILYQAPASGALTGVEISRIEPRTIYVALYEYVAARYRPKLARSRDGGTTWDTVDIAPFIGATVFRIVAVDPQNANRLFLRIQAVDEQLAISDDGGDSFRVPLRISNGTLSGFALLPDGTIVVGGVIFDQAKVRGGLVHRSTDGGHTFQPWVRSPRVRALAQRDGQLYVAGDNDADGFALAASSDDGLTVTPLMRFTDVSAVRDCVKSSCKDGCLAQAARGLWPITVCGEGANPQPVSVKRAPQGCGCSAHGVPPDLNWTVLTLVLGAAPRRRRYPG